MPAKDNQQPVNKQLSQSVIDALQNEVTLDPEKLEQVVLGVDPAAQDDFKVTSFIGSVSSKQILDEYKDALKPKGKTLQDFWPDGFFDPVIPEDVSVGGKALTVSDIDKAADLIKEAIVTGKR